MGAVEETIIRYSSRGMDRLRPYLPEDYCLQAARVVASWPKGTVLIASGFCVNGRPETDGPSGTVVLARACQKLGHTVIVLTDGDFCNCFSALGVQALAVPNGSTEAECRQLLACLNPVGMISVERCGRNERGLYENSRGVDIGACTAPVDLLFSLAKGTIPTIGVGDGGNEIGMGNLAGAIHAENIPLNPCAVTVDHLVIATVSNWGAYGIAACLGMLVGERLLPTAEELHGMQVALLRQGCIDGITGAAEISVDGFPEKVEVEVLRSLWQIAC